MLSQLDKHLPTIAKRVSKIKSKNRNLPIKNCKNVLKKKAKKKCEAKKLDNKLKRWNILGKKRNNGRKNILNDKFKIKKRGSKVCVYKLSPACNRNRFKYEIGRWWWCWCSSHINLNFKTSSIREVTKPNRVINDRKNELNNKLENITEINVPILSKKNLELKLKS